MKNKSDTNLIRHYCLKHRDEMFDVGMMHGHFSDIPLSNFRKYISKLVEEGVFTPVSKKVYYIGANPADEQIDRAIHGWYLNLFQFRPIKGTILHELGIIENEPKVKTYFRLWNHGNKKVLNYQFIDIQNFEPLFGIKNKGC